VFFCAAILSTSSQAQPSKSLIIRVHSDEQISYLDCKDFDIQSCPQGVRLKAAIDFLNSWQPLKEKYSSIVIRLDPATYRITSPIIINRGIAKVTPVTLTTDLGARAEINGSQNLTLVNEPPPTPNISIYTADKMSTGFDLKLHPNSQRLLRDDHNPYGFGFATPERIRAVLLGKKFLPISTYPNNGYMDAPMARLTDGNISLSIPWGDDSPVKLGDHIRVSGYYGNTWAYESHSLRVTSIEDKRLTLASRSPPKYTGRNFAQIRIEGVSGESEQALRWLTRGPETLELRAAQPFSQADLSVPISAGLLHIDGVNNLTITNIDFLGSQGTAVSIKNTMNTIISNISISGATGTCLLAQKVSGLKLSKGTISNCGGSGVELEGGDISTLRPGANTLSDSEIYDGGIFLRSYYPLVRIDGVGNAISRCKLHDTPHSAIMFQGVGHVISENEIYNTLSETDDSGSIYTGRDWTARGTRILGNFLHNNGKPLGGRRWLVGIYLDDQASGTTIQGNVFSGGIYGVFIGGGRNNSIEGNLFVDTKTALYLDARGIGEQHAKTFDPNWDLLSRLRRVPYSSTPYTWHFPELADILTDRPGAPIGNVFRHNMLVGTQSTTHIAYLATGYLTDYSNIQAPPLRTEDANLITMPESKSTISIYCKRFSVCY